MIRAPLHSATSVVILGQEGSIEHRLQTAQSAYVDASGRVTIHNGQRVFSCERCRTASRLCKLRDYLQEEWAFEMCQVLPLRPFCIRCCLRDHQEVAVWRAVHWYCLQIAGRDLGSVIFRTYLQTPGSTLGFTPTLKIARRVPLGTLGNSLLFALGVSTMWLFWVVFLRIPRESFMRVVWPCFILMTETCLVSKTLKLQPVLEKYRMSLWTAGKAAGYVSSVMCDRLREL